MGFASKRSLFTGTADGSRTIDGNDVSSSIPQRSGGISLFRFEVLMSSPMHGRQRKALSVDHGTATKYGLVREPVFASCVLQYPGHVRRRLCVLHHRHECLG